MHNINKVDNRKYTLVVKDGLNRKLFSITGSIELYHNPEILMMMEQDTKYLPIKIDIIEN